MAIFGIFESSALSYQIFFSGALMLMQSKCVESSDIKLHGLEKNVPFYKTSKHFTVIGDISESTGVSKLKAWNEKKNQVYFVFIGKNAEYVSENISLQQ